MNIFQLPKRDPALISPVSKALGTLGKQDVQVNKLHSLRGKQSNQNIK